MDALVIPDDLSTLSDDELALLAKDVRERLEALNDDKALAELGDDAVALIENAMAADDTVNAEQSKREEAAAEQAQILADTRDRLAKRLNPDEPDEPEATTDDADEGDAEPTADADT